MLHERDTLFQATATMLWSWDISASFHLLELTAKTSMMEEMFQ